MTSKNHAILDEHSPSPERWSNETSQHNQHVNNNLTNEAITVDSNNGDPAKMKEQAKLSAKATLINCLIHLLLFGVTCYITYKCFGEAVVLFSWHPTFMMVGYLILMSQAVLTMSDNNFLTNNLEYKSRVYVHWVLQALAGVLITIAFSCIFINKVRMGKPHFQSTHGLVGLTTICMTLIAIGGGVFTKYGFRLRTLVRPVYSKIGHSALGILTYMLAMATILLGIYSKWGEHQTTAEIRGVIFGILCVTTIYVLIKPMLLMATRFKGVLTRDSL